MEVRETGKISQMKASEEKVKETEQDRHFLVLSDSDLNLHWAQPDRNQHPHPSHTFVPTRKMLMLHRCLMSMWTRLMATLPGQRSWQGLL